MALAPQAPALAPVPGNAPPPVPPAGDIPNPPDSIAKLGGQAVAAERGLGTSLADINERENARLQALDKQWNEVPRPEFKPPPQPTVQSTDPKTVWASSAMVLAAIGSLFTRQPLVTAINASAKVLDAYHEGDLAKANAAFQTWKIANDNYVKAFTIQQQSYDQVRNHLGDLENMTMQQAESAKRDAIASTDALAHAFNDQATLELREWDDRVQLWEFRDQRKQQLLLNGDKLVEQHEFANAYEALQQDPEYQAAVKPDPKTGKPTDAMKAYRMVTAIMPQSMKPLTQDQEDSKAAEIRKELDGSKPGTISAHYDAITNALPPLLALEHTNAVRDGVTKQTVDADLFTQLFNGGRAIRGFQMQMLTQHASLLDKADVLERQLAAGGHLSGDQVKDMIEAAKIYAQAVDQLYGQDIQRGKAAAMKERLSDPDEVVPFDYDPNLVRNILSTEGSAAAAPAVGTVEKGYRFKGGDPSDQASWERVQQ